jgi:hypothetical protein
MSEVTSLDEWRATIAARAARAAGPVDEASAAFRRYVDDLYAGHEIQAQAEKKRIGGAWS